MKSPKNRKRSKKLKTPDKIVGKGTNFALYLEYIEAKCSIQHRTNKYVEQLYRELIFRLVSVRVASKICQFKAKNVSIVVYTRDTSKCRFQCSAKMSEQVATRRQDPKHSLRSRGQLWLALTKSFNAVQAF